MNNTTYFAKNFKNLLSINETSIRKSAVILNVSRSAIARWLYTDNALPSSYSRDQIYYQYGVPLGKLIFDDLTKVDLCELLYKADMHSPSTFIGNINKCLNATGQSVTEWYHCNKDALQDINQFDLFNWSSGRCTSPKDANKIILLARLFNVQPDDLAGDVM